MNRFTKLIVAAGTLLPSIALAHEAPHHANQTIWQQIFDLEHILLFALPTAIITTLIYRHFKKKIHNS
jgi:hypothetical protein